MITYDDYTYFDQNVKCVVKKFILLYNKVLQYKELICIHTIL